MSLIRFNYNNLVDIATITKFTEHPNFPAERVQHMWPKKSYRSRYGANSGWGYFGINASKKKIDFEETGATPLVATLVEGAYNADSLSAEIKTQLDAAGASTYTVTYSDSTNKFTIVSNGAGGAGILTLLWDSGANKANSVGDTIGFDESADDTGGLTYTSDNMRIHTAEVLVFDLLAARELKGFGIKCHNLQSGAVLKIQGDTSSSFASPDYTQTVTVTDDLIMVYFSSAQTYRYWRIFIEDPTNPDGYIEIGRAHLGSYFSPVAEARRDYKEDIEDESGKQFSRGGQISVNQEDDRWSGNFTWDFMDDDLGDDLEDFKTMWEYSKAFKDMFITLDVNSISTRTVYARIASPLNIGHIVDEKVWRVDLKLQELL